MLRIDSVAASYGHVKALSNVSLKVEEKATVTLIGSNGAGKSTLLKVISGLLNRRPGRSNSSESGSMATHRTGSSPGIVHCPEGRRVFPELTVTKTWKWGHISSVKTEVKDRIDRLFDSFPILRERHSQLAGTLSGGNSSSSPLPARSSSGQRCCSSTNPPSVCPILVDQVEQILLRLKREEITILLVEQNANMAMEVADYAYVMETGSIILEGPSNALRKDEK